MSHRLSDRLRPLPGTLLFAALTLLAVAGCGKGTNPTPPGSSTYTGSVTGETISGSLTVTIGTATPAAGLGIATHFSASGTYTPSGQAAIALSGGYDDTFDAYVLEGNSGGSHWLFTGNLTAFGFRGSGSDTNDVITEVVHTSLLKGDATDITVVLGTYMATSGPSGLNGLFNFGFDGSGQVRGDAVAPTAAHALLDGTITAGAISIVQAASPPGPTPATGTYTAPNATGGYNDGATPTPNIGTWSGAKTP